MSNIIIPTNYNEYSYIWNDKRCRVYECFYRRAREGMRICINIFPYMLAMLLAIGILRESIALDYIIDFVNPIVKYIGITRRSITPLVFAMKPLSGSGALGIYTDIITNYGVQIVI